MTKSWEKYTPQKSVKILETKETSVPDDVPGLPGPLEAKAENVGGLSWENMQNKEAGRLSLFSVKN